MQLKRYLAPRYLTPGPAYDLQGEPSRSEDFDKMVDFFSDRYGSVENFKKTAAKDPVGVIADFATVLTGAGGVLRGSGKVAAAIPQAGRVASVMEKTGSALQKAGGTIEPTNVIKQAARAIPAERMYESAVKWNTVSKKPGRTGQQVREALTKTALNERIMPTYKGLNKLRSKLDELDKQIERLVIEPSARGVSINAGELLRHFDELEDQLWRTSGKPVKSINEVKRIKKEFMAVHGVFKDKNGNVSLPSNRRAGEIPRGDLIGFEQLSPQEIQRKKTTIYKDLESSYEKIMSSPASVRAQKQIARAAKDVMAEIVPEIAEVNKSYKPLIELYKALDQKAGRISNYDLIPAATTWKAGAGFAATGGTAGGAAAGILAGIIDTPVVKAKLAILI